jgi:hypothetical protein
MWGSLIGAVFGALVGGGVTYYVQRRLEAKRQHEETVEALYQKVFKLSEIVSDLTAGVRASSTESVPYPEEARELAQEIEELATDLWDEDLKRDVITAMNREYDSPEEICWQLEKVELALRERAYPTLYDIKPEGRETPSGVALRWLNDKDKSGDWAEGWRGPAKIQFIFRMKERGRKLRVEEESD